MTTTTDHGRIRLSRLQAVDGKDVYINHDAIKSFAESEVSPDIEIPKGAEVAQTFITLKGEARGIKVDGTPKEVLRVLQEESFLA